MDSILKYVILIFAVMVVVKIGMVVANYVGEQIVGFFVNLWKIIQKYIPKKQA